MSRRIGFLEALARRELEGAAGGRQCAACGCDERHPCAGGCGWLPAFPDLCTACAPRPVAEDGRPWAIEVGPIGPRPYAWIRVRGRSPTQVVQRVRRVVARVFTWRWRAVAGDQRPPTVAEFRRAVAATLGAFEARDPTYSRLGRRPRRARRGAR